MNVVKESILLRDNSDFKQQFLSKYKNQVSEEVFHAFCQEAAICPECLTESLTISSEQKTTPPCSNIDSCTLKVTEKTFKQVCRCNCQMCKFIKTPKIWKVTETPKFWNEVFIERIATSNNEPNTEIVCRNCGLVIGDFLEKQHSLPGVGVDTWYNDTCSLSFGKSLGTELGKYQMYSVLAKSEAGKIDIGKRRLIIKNMTRVEIPQVQQLLFYGSQLCKEHGLDGKDDRSIIFANELGRILRLAGTIALALSQNTIGIKKLVKACFLYLHKKTFYNGSQLQKQLKVDDATVEWIEYVINSYSLPKGLEIRRH